MGKLSRKKTFDGKKVDDKQQSKISSFFENKSTAKQGSSKLFTSIAEAKKAAALSSTNIISEEASSSKASVGFRPALHSVNSPLSGSGHDDVVCVDDSDNGKCAQNHTERDLSVGKNHQKSQTCDEGNNKLAQDNVNNVTPLKSTQNERTSVSPDVIYNTPGVENNGGGSGGTRFKSKQVGRSFLRPFHLVTKQPDLKSREEIMKEKIRMTKSAGPVSVSFNSCEALKVKQSSGDDLHSNQTVFCEPSVQISKEDNCEKESMQTTIRDDGIVVESNNKLNVKGLYSLCNSKSESTDRGVNDKQFVCLQEIGTNENVETITAQVREISDQDNMLKSVKCSKERENKETTKAPNFTPTKNYQCDLVDIVKVKRMAKPGLSPESKRPMEESKEIIDIYGDTDAERVKRNLNLESVDWFVHNSEPPCEPGSMETVPLQLEDDGAKEVNSERVLNSESLELIDSSGLYALKKNSTSSTLQQPQTKSKKFTIQKAKALGWKAQAKSSTKNISATLRDDSVLDELMQGLSSSSVNDEQGASSCQLSKPVQRKKLTVTKASAQSKTSDNALKSPRNSSLPSDEVFQSFGMDLPEDMKFQGEFQTSSSDNNGINQKQSAKKVNMSGNVSIGFDNFQRNSNDFCLLNDSDTDSFLLAALEEGANQGSNSKSPVDDDLARNFVALSPFKKPNEKPKDEISTLSKCEFRFSDLWQRFKVMHVEFDSHADEKYLTLCDERVQTSTFHCTLQGFWVDTKVNEGDIVNVIGRFDDNNQCVVNDQSGILVVSPDLLLSGTSVVSSVFCARKSVLNDKFKGVDQGNVSMLYGSIIHSLFQAALRDNLRQEGEIMQVARTLLTAPKFLHAMYSQGVAEATVLTEIKQYVPPLMAWMEKYMAPLDKSGLSSSKPQKSSVLVTDIQDIEENIWSPRFGLKGKIDLTVKAKLQDKTGLVETKTVPLELKTGKASFSSEHKGQVTLYSMMYGDRRSDPGEGLLLYLKTGQMESVQAKPQSMSGLIQLRNSLASYFKDQVSERMDDSGQRKYSVGRLPEPINNQRACDKCAHLLNCCLYQRSVESDSTSPPSPPLPPSHPMTRLVPESLSHLDPEDLNYFTHWVTCLQMEAQEASRKHQGPIWNMGSTERENKGDCLSRLLIQSSQLGIQESQDYNEGKGCSLTFVRHHGFQAWALLDSVGLVVNDAVVVSSEDGRLIALATGFIRTLSAKHVEVVVDRDNLCDITMYKNIVFRLDRNTNFSTSSQLMANLTRLMENTSHAAKLRELIIRKRQPQSELKIPMAWVRMMKPVFQDLNKPQKIAILKVLMAKDYTLIRGFPGTGKTSTIVALVRVLHLLGKSVLLTSYTHSAVDNILLKLRHDDVPFLRLGRQARIHPSIRPHSAEILTSTIPSVEELKKFYDSYSVVATSCLGVSHTLFTHRRFDVCIVDEASQVLQPACAGPLFHCQKFVLVGDSHQLAPVVQSKSARSLGMDESLFSRLEDGGATYDLYLQYRMNKVIMAISNGLVYHGRLECGNQEVASQCLHFELSTLEDCSDWMRETLNPELSRSVVFVDTQKLPTSPKTGGTGTCNETEASLVVSLLQTLSKASVSTRDLGVISPYRSQVKLLQRKVQGCPDIAGVEVNTVDQYQGRDKRVIIVSFALTEEGARDSAGDLLKDIRRLNVAMTRARHKLILVGNAKTLRAWPHLQSIMTDLESEQCRWFKSLRLENPVGIPGPKRK